jgi:hypothetical protein
LVTMDDKQNSRVIKTGHFIAYSSLFLAILLAIHLFVILDDHVVKQLLVSNGQKPTANAIGTIRNSFQFTGTMYVFAYLAGIVAIWNRHTYLWWFMFATFTSNVLYNLVNISALFKAIIDAKSTVNILPLSIVMVASTLLAIYMLVVSIKRKSTFNR